MRYVLAFVLDDAAGTFNNEMRRDVFEKFGAKSSKLPAHITIKSPFEAERIEEMEHVLERFAKKEKAAPIHIKGYNHFDDRVIYMDVFASKEAKEMHDRLIENLQTLPWLQFQAHDGKDKIFHLTITSKKIQKIFSELWEYVHQSPCDFESSFSTISLYRWEQHTWILHKEYILQ
ncbi:2'-5' RNA ligase family protein [Priestia taiwanensis]|uniref:Phosphoesterase n=1 Tax=Priestia taiwanensis TaxID=1347902 RepID=A0A917AVQ9_9BACI|nr:2'-5' RNA ligase family protein [Priestia taiwanensis]MBM7364736.1 2'-5' RNA ligase [Priestia taiwanensis]GGE79227.1 phosphoesterase [Priestia taiwanensis]